jgi:hypothetical protein
MRRSVRPGGIFVLLLLIVAVAMTVVCAVAAAPAVAAPTEPTLVGSALQDAITAAGPSGLDGYFNTVLQGSTISQVSVKILAVADGQNPTDGSPLILFQITDPTVLAQGGLAEGMSGSPLRVGDYSDPQDADPLVGAVSYGDIFTTNGLGFATPIDLMSSIEDNYTVDPAEGAHAGTHSLASPLLKAAGPVLPKTRALALARPLKTSAGTFGKFIVARSQMVARALHPAVGTAVFAPLSAVEVGGIPAGGRAFKQLSAQLAKRGVDIIPAGGGVGGGDPPFATDFVGGASVAAVLAHGYFWAAFVGTVTYSHVNDDGDTVVVAFGHPADYDGASGLDLANALVSGIWSSSYVPYKLVSLGAIRGLITQDRLYGIAGVVTTTPPVDVPVNATATLGAGAAVGDTTYVSQWIAGNLNWNYFLISDACYFPVFKATDAYQFPGFATTDTVVKVDDGNGQAITPPAELKNVWDDIYDVGYYTTYDIGDMIDALTSNPNGTAPATVTEVDFSATVSSAHHSAEVLDFSVPGGLKIGDNTIRTVVRDYGEVGTHEVDVTLNIPKKTMLSGDVEVEGSADEWGYDDYYDDSMDYDATHNASRPFGASVPGIPPIADSESLQDLVNEVNAWPVNDTLDVNFYTDDSDGPGSDSANTPSSSTTLTDGGSPWFAEGYIDKYTPDMMMRPMVPVVVSGHMVRLRGVLDAEDSDGTRVAIYKGAATKPFITVPVRVTQGMGFFSLKTKLSKTTTFRAVWDGSESYIGARTSCKVFVVHSHK